MPKRPSLIRQNAWSAVVFYAGLAASACAAPEEPEYSPPVGNGGAGGTAGGTSGGTSGGGTAGTNVAGTSTSGGSAGTGTSGGSGGTSGSSGGTSGSSGEGGSAATSSAGSAGRGGSGGTSGASGAAGTGTGGSGNSAGTGGGNGGSAGAPTGDLPFLDDFEDGNADGWISVDDEGVAIEGWSVVMDGSQVFKQGSASSDPSWSIGGNSAWTDQVVEVKLKFDDVPDESSMAMIAARFSSFESYYYLELRADGGIKIRKRFDDGTADVTRYDPDVPLAGGTWYTVGLGAVGSTLTAYLDGIPVATGTDADVKSGGIGIGTSEEAVVAFDDVSVTAP